MPNDRSCCAKGILPRISNVEKSILVLVFFIYRAHKRSSWWKDFIDEDEDGLLWRKLDALPDHIDELPNSKVGGDKVLFLIDCRNVRLLDLFTDDRNTVRVLLADTLRFGLALLKGMLVLEFRSHGG